MLKITIAQLNPIIGDFSFNFDKLCNAVLKAKQDNADLIIFSELFLTGYPPQDLLSNQDFLIQIKNWLERVLAFSKTVPNIGILFGMPRNTKNQLTNSAVLVQNGVIIFEQAKTLLPTYDVFDETRYFISAKERRVFKFKNTILGISICEDAWQLEKENWYELNPLEELQKLGAEIIINLSASPFFMNKNKERIVVFQEQIAKIKLPIIYVNQVGANDELIFDGQSLILNAKGTVVYQAKAFIEETTTIELEKVLDFSEIQINNISEEEQIFHALVLGIRDYVQKNGFTKVLLGLSGGIDSAITAVLAVSAVGAENVLGISMPGPYSSVGSVEDSRILAKNLGIEFQVISIKEIFQVYLDFLKTEAQSWGSGDRRQETGDRRKNSFGAQELCPARVEGGLSPSKIAAFQGGKGDEVPLEKNTDLAEQNLQSRIRGNILMAYSNKFNYLLLNTGNKSETAVGYCTLYGDMNGGLAVLSDVTKEKVYTLAKFINKDQKIIPSIIITKAPSAELRPDQKDQDTLPPYEILDQIIELFIDQNFSAKDIIKQGFNKETVNWVIKAIKNSEYKRKQSPPGLKITKKAFGRGRKFPITANYDLSY